MKPWPFRLLAFLAALFALVWGRAAAAQAPDEPTILAPHDVAVLVQPSAVKLGAMPADFERVDAGWLVLEFPSSVREQVESARRDAEEFRARLSSDLGQPVLPHVLVRVARGPQQMIELAPEGAPPPTYAAGVAYPAVHLILLTLVAPGTWETPDLSEVLGHELTHLALDEAVEDRHVPRWFNEGFAIHESGELALKRLRVLWDATVSHRLLPLADLDRSFPDDGPEVGVAYAESADVVRFLMRDDDRARFGSLVQRVKAGTPFERALADAYSTDLRKLEFEWREEASHRFGLVPILTGGGVVWTLIAGLAVLAYVKRRRRAKAKLAQWAREEAEVDAKMALERAHLKEQAGAPADEDEVAPHGRPGVPVVEHDGRFYTLH
jgi:hypothetical protein